MRTLAGNEGELAVFSQGVADQMLALGKDPKEWVEKAARLYRSSKQHAKFGKLLVSYPVAIKHLKAKEVSQYVHHDGPPLHVGVLWRWSACHSYYHHDQVDDFSFLPALVLPCFWFRHPTPEQI